MLSTGGLMLGKALLTAGAALGFCFWQLRALKRMRQQDRSEPKSPNLNRNAGAEEGGT